MTDLTDDPTPLDAETARLVEQRDNFVARAREIPSVAAALAVFEAANQRAPVVPPARPQVRFSTGANG